MNEGRRFSEPAKPARRQGLGTENVDLAQPRHLAEVLPEGGAVRTLRGAGRWTPACALFIDVAGFVGFRGAGRQAIVLANGAVTGPSKAERHG